jgi:8-hydroxy-5-deazaflavin:NADPH oxidoreductase
LSGLLSRVAGSTALAPEGATASAEVVALTVPWSAAEQVVKSLGDLEHKVLLDCTNPVMAWPKLDHASGKSGRDQVAEWATGGRVVKIFNTTGFENMADPNYPGGKLTMFYVSDDSGAKRMAHELN